MAPRPFLVLTPAQAAQLREATAGRLERLEPRLIAAGPHAGQSAIPVRTRADPAFRSLRTTLNGVTATVLDPDVAWPQTED